MLTSLTRVRKETSRSKKHRESKQDQFIEDHTKTHCNWSDKNKGQEQDERVERPEFTCCHENTKITTTKPLAEKRLKPTKKDILLPKTKKPPQWEGRRGAFSIQISYPVGGWPTNWEIIISQRFSYKSESSWPQVRLSQLEVWHQEKGHLSIGLWRAWLQELHRTGGDKLHFWRMHTRSPVHQDPEEKAVTPQEPQPDLPTGPGGSPGQAGGVLDLTVDKAQVAEVNFFKIAIISSIFFNHNTIHY